MKILSVIVVLFLCIIGLIMTLMGVNNRDRYKEDGNMSLKFDYCCKECWHIWKTPKKALFCPKCGAKNIDLQYEVTGG